MRGLTESLMSPPRRYERGFAIVFLLLSTGAFVNLFLKPGNALETSSGIPALQAVWVALYAITMGFLFKAGKNAWQVFLREWRFLLLPALAIVSCAWSDSWGLTARRGSALFVTTLSGFYLATRYSYAEQIKLLASVCKIAVVLSYLSGILGIGTAVDEIDGAWYGIYTQRNSLGLVMVLSVLVFILWSQIRPAEKWSARAWAVASLFLLLLSGSMTATISFIAVMFLYAVLQLVKAYPRRARTVLLISLCLAGCGCVWAWSHSDELFDLLDRDATLTGRTTIWGAALAQGMERPWLGYGYEAFWLINSGPAQEIRDLARWDVPGAHNGFIELWLDLGLAGLAVFLVNLVSYIRKSLRVFAAGTGADCGWPILFLVLVVLVNLTQSALVTPNFIFWIVYMVIFFRISLVAGSAVESRIA
jgi:exopolysaccharide production protein ExoQ